MIRKRKRKLIPQLLKIQRAAARSDDGRRCLVAPSPELSKIIDAEMKKARNKAAVGLSRMLRMRAPTRAS